jgi:hypothetical protein
MKIHAHKLLIALNLILASQFVFAADVSMTERSFRISGEIVAGDYQKFLKLANQKIGARVILSSPGGDLNEAVKIAELVSRLNINTEVPKGEICASACFFIWINGERRVARKINSNSDKVSLGLHRPYLSNPTVERNSTENQINVQRRTIAYLEGKLIPRRLIDIMMARPSNDIYWMTETDLSELGEYPSHIEELYIAKCKYDRAYDDKWFDLMNQNKYAEAEALEKKQTAVEDCSIDVHIERLIRARQAFLSQRK